MVLRQVGFRRFFRGRRRWRCIRRLIFGHSLQKCFRRHKEKASRHRTAEVENPVIVARRPSNEHVLEHLLDRPGRTAVADEIGTKFPVRGAPKRHVIAQDLHFLAVLDDGVERAVRGGWLNGII